MHVQRSSIPLPLVLPSAHIPLLPCTTKWQTEAKTQIREDDEQEYASAPSTCPSPVSRQASDFTVSLSCNMENIEKLSGFGEYSSSSAQSNESCSSRHSSPVLRYASKMPTIYKVEQALRGNTLLLPMSVPLPSVNLNYHHSERLNFDSQERETTRKRKRAHDGSMAQAEPLVLDAVEALLSLKAAPLNQLAPTKND